MHIYGDVWVCIFLACTRVSKHISRRVWRVKIFVQSYRTNTCVRLCAYVKIYIYSWDAPPITLSITTTQVLYVFAKLSHKTGTHWAGWPPPSVTQVNTSCLLQTRLVPPPPVSLIKSPNPLPLPVCLPLPSVTSPPSPSPLSYLPPPNPHIHMAPPSPQHLPPYPVTCNSWQANWPNYCCQSRVNSFTFTEEEFRGLNSW